MEIPYTVKARPDTGLWNAKIGIWLFLASEVMLFGGLFSSYIFLRVGADFPWPVNVQKVALGFTNTLVLIASSVTVVFAWASLKMRKYNQYRLYMFITLLCACGFLVIKFFEYKGKLTHYSLEMQDGGVITGHLPKRDHDLHHYVFEEVNSIKANVNTTDLSYIMKYASTKEGDAKEVTFRAVRSVKPAQSEQGTEPGATEPGGTEPGGTEPGGSEPEGANPGETIAPSEPSGAEPVDLVVTNEWLRRQAEAIKELDSATKEIGEIEEKLASADTPDDGKVELGERLKELKEKTGSLNNEIMAVNGYVEIIPSVPLKFSVPRTIPREPRKDYVISDTDEAPGSLGFRDGSFVFGNLVNDSVTLEVDEIDLQALNLKKVKDGKIENARVFAYLGEEVKQEFLKHMKEEFEHGREEFGKDYPVETDPSVRRKALKFSLVGEEIAGKVKPDQSLMAEEGEVGGEKGHGEGHGEHEEGHEHAVIKFKDEDIKFYSNFSPRLNTYYAIYFLLTGLHGLHIIAGIIVLGYFFLFGKKLYDKDPEHMANRVEVGGLFWHFVDLVWIFLFPILYLM